LARSWLTLGMALGIGALCVTSCGAVDGTPVNPRGCTEIGCIDGLYVTFRPGDSWPAGAYRFDLETEAGSASCSGSLPLPACGTPGLTCQGVPVQIGESGCALPASAHGFSDLRFPSAPKRVHVRISRDNQMIFERELEPTYRRAQPNGAGCGPVCNSASETLAVF
jgi:hypothetical protein